MRKSLKYALVALWPAMVVSGQIARLKTYSEPDAQEVYRVLMAPYKRPILVLSTTIDGKSCSVSEKEITDPEFRRALAAFHDVNKQVWDLSKVLGNRRAITNVELDEIFKPGLVEGWKQFRQKHPDSSGYVSLSAVGFNDAHTVAVVYSAGHCAVNCAAGGLQYFRRTLKGWQRVEKDFPNCHWFS